MNADPSRPRALRPDTSAPEPTPEPPLPPLPPPPAPPRRRRPGTLETVLLASTAALVAAVAWPIAMAGLHAESSDPDAALVDTHDPGETLTPSGPVVVPAADARIQIALLLDTSSSMDGLIDQARSQLWRVVDALDSATFQGATPRLEIAIYEYGNDNLSVDGGYTRQVIPFSSELDRVSQALFALTTQGGSEFSGQAIARATDELAWSTSPSTLRVLYVAGNEEFTQGPVDFREAVASAKAKGVVINTLNCTGGANPDIGWAEAASIGGGKFFTIDHNQRAVYVAAPQDAEIARLGTAINDTYLYYGRRGADAHENQFAQDDNAAKSMGSSGVMRQLSKGSAHYRNPQWDLVDGLAEGTVSLDDLDRSTLPADVRDLPANALEAEVEKRRTEREEIRTKLSALKQARETFLAQKRAEADLGADPRLDDAILISLAEQATAAGFSLDSAKAPPTPT